MPEGDTIHKVAGYLRPRLEGRTLGDADRPLAGVITLSGHTVEAVRVHGKHLLIDTDRGDTLRVHLGMHGTWHHYRPGEKWKLPEGLAKVSLTTPAGIFVCFKTLQVELVRTRAAPDHRVLSRLGPDLLHDDWSLDEVVARAQARTVETPTAGELLLNQRVASGIGNVYKSEVLFLERVHPWTPSASLDEPTLRRLFQRSADLMRWNTGGGPRTTTFDPRARRRERGEPRLWVYGRRDAPCLRCKTQVRRALQGHQARVTYWCPTCQPEIS